MKYIVIIIPLFILGVLFVSSDTKNGLEQITLNQLSDSLDYYIQHRQDFVQEKEQQIRQIKQQLNGKLPMDRQCYLINARLAEAYKKFNVDSAISYAERNIELAAYHHLSGELNASRITLALLLSLKGVYMRAEHLLSSINRSALDSTQLYAYYSACHQFWECYLVSSGDESGARKQLQHYYDSLTQVMNKNEVIYQLFAANRLSDSGQYQEAEKQYLELLDKEPVGTPTYAMITCSLAYNYLHRKRNDLAKAYFIRSAIADIRNATRENLSLHNLATLEFQRANIEKAAQYAQVAVEDALQSNIHFRTAQIYHFYTQLNALYKQEEVEQKAKLKTSLYIISGISVCLVLLAAYIFLQIKRISRIKENLAISNTQLRELNSRLNSMNDELNEKNGQLNEIGNVKEKYIAQFFDLCSNYINKMEENQNQLYKLTVNRQYEQLISRLKSTTFIDDEIETLYKHFDSIFLSLYPTFIDDFNNLLTDDARIQLKSEHLLNKELRIYALLRLGLTDSTRMAAFLRCSISTIYNYRTRMRNKAKVNRSDFEAQVMNIGSTNASSL